MTNDLCRLPARTLATLLARGDVSAREVLEAHLAQVERWNPVVNAIVTLDAEGARRRARELDDRFVREGPVGPLHGLPVAHKDLAETAGLRTTYGSPLFADFVPAEDAPAVARIRAAGAVTIGKTNTPEFGAGSQTFNRLFGVTRNPYDLSKTSGGSSGGAAAALACGMVPIADGSDMGGSLRNPASFCNVVGLRPTPGRVPQFARATPWLPLAVTGPMARTVADVALLLGVMMGDDSRDPLASGGTPAPFLAFEPRSIRGLRIAWSPTLGGLPVERAVLDVLESAVRTFETLGGVVEQAEPDLAGADLVFETFRGLAMAAAYGPLADENPDLVKDTVRWNIDVGRRLTGEDVAAAWRSWGTLLERARTFFSQWDLLACPAAQVLPFPAELEFPPQVAGVRMTSYIDWMRACTRITVLGCPALSVPAGFSPEGLPVGLQLVAPPRAELRLLEAAALFEEATGWWRRPPPEPHPLEETAGLS